MWVTWRLSYKRQNFLPFTTPQFISVFFHGVRVPRHFFFCVFLLCVLWYRLRLLHTHGFVRLQLFIGGFMSYLRYLCVLAYSGVNYILCCVCFFVLYTPCCHFLCIVHYGIQNVNIMDRTQCWTSIYTRFQTYSSNIHSRIS